MRNDKRNINNIINAAQGPTIQQVLNGSVHVQSDVEYLEVRTDREFFDTYSFVILSTIFCTSLTDIINNINTRIENMKNNRNNVQ